MVAGAVSLGGTNAIGGGGRTRDLVLVTRAEGIFVADAVRDS